MRCRIILLALVWGLSANTSLSGQTSDEASANPVNNLPAPATIQLRKESRLLVNSYPRPDGLVVAWAHPSSPANNMRKAGDPNTRGVIEAGDLITHVNGQPITSLSRYYEIMRSVGGTARVTIKDVRSAHSIEWDVNPVVVDVPIVARPPVRVTGCKAHIIIAASTDDQSIGKNVAVSLQDLKKVVESQIRQERVGSLTVLEADNCRAGRILLAIDQLNVKPQDAILFVYLGHGAFDPSRAAGDTSGGHLFQLPGGDLMRRTLLQHVVAKNGRTSIILSDCCNVAGKVSLAPVYETRIMKVTGWTNLESLLFAHRGLIDATASSRGQFSWSDNSIGGWFAYQLSDTFQNSKKDDWDTTWKSIVSKTEALYRERRALALRNPGFQGPARHFLENQLEMIPTAYQFEVYSDQTGDTPLDTIQVSQFVSREVSTNP
jgi:hypothetical protein